jgi:Zn-dependent M28 family amino/carboxypeptidase
VGSLLAGGRVVRTFEGPAQVCRDPNVLLSFVSLPPGKARLRRQRELAPVQPGRSVELEHVLVDYFSSQGLPWVYRPYDGRSDYQSFVNAGIGAGGLTSGSDQVKTAEQARLFGGTAGQVMHPCYHLACDRLDTVNTRYLDDLSDAGAHAIFTFAQTP